MLFKTSADRGTIADRGAYIEIVRRDYKDDHSYYQAILKIKVPALAAPASVVVENKHAK